MEKNLLALKTVAGHLLERESVQLNCIPPPPQKTTVTVPERLNLICSIHLIRDSLGKKSWRVGGSSRYGGVGGRGSNVTGISRSHSVITLNTDGFNPLIRRHSLDDWEKKIQQDLNVGCLLET